MGSAQAQEHPDACFFLGRREVSRRRADGVTLGTRGVGGRAAQAAQVRLFPECPEFVTFHTTS